jgi:hypothetical protein
VVTSKKDKEKELRELEGPLAGKELSDLAIAGANGTLYVNIHTQRNPNGESADSLNQNSSFLDLGLQNCPQMLFISISHLSLPPFLFN